MKLFAAVMLVAMVVLTEADNEPGTGDRRPIPPPPVPMIEYFIVENPGEHKYGGCQCDVKVLNKEVEPRITNETHIQIDPTAGKAYFLCTRVVHGPQKGPWKFGRGYTQTIWVPEIKTQLLPF